MENIIRMVIVLIIKDFYKDIKETTIETEAENIDFNEKNY